MATGAYSDDMIEIEKLEGTDDWWEWKYNITLQLKAKKLWSHVDGTANLAEDDSNDEREKFEHTAVWAWAMIIRGLSKQVTSLVLRCDGPKAVWDRLVEEFEVKTVQNTLLLQTQVSQMRLKEGGHIKEHLCAMKEVYDRLAMLEDEVAEKDLVINLLASLPPSYDALQSLLLAQGPGIKWMDVQQALILGRAAKRAVSPPRKQRVELNTVRRKLSKGCYAQS